MSDITQSTLRDILSYDPETGIFTWRTDRTAGDGALRRPAGSTAGYKLATGYVLIHLGRSRYLAHRLAWLYVYGTMPSCIMDHADRDRSNNRISNLRLCSKSQNGANSTKRSGRAESALKGAYFRADRNKWRSNLTFDGRSIYLGTFDSQGEAHAAYVAKAKELFGEFARAA